MCIRDSWYTDNTYVSEDKSGNKRFLKKEPIRRKTDGFHAFIAALYKRELIEEGNASVFLRLGSFFKDRLFPLLSSET